MLIELLNQFPGNYRVFQLAPALWRFDINKLILFSVLLARGISHNKGSDLFLTKTDPSLSYAN